MVQPVEDSEVRQSQQSQNFFLLSSLALFLISNTSCASTRYNPYLHYTEAAEGQVFLSTLPHFEDSAFFERGSGWEGEHAKILYLLDRIATSPNGFIRNGEAHDGRTARQWFLYKMTHWVNSVQTAQDFITRVATFSQKTGKRYLMETPDGKVYSLASVLRNELFAFESASVKFRTIDRTTLSKPISLSPTRAVATSTQ